MNAADFAPDTTDAADTLAAHDKPAKPASMNPEQAADLAALRAAAVSQDRPGGPQDTATPEVRPELAAEIAALMALAASALSPAFPSLSRIYTADTTQAAGHAIAAVCQKHGWLQNGVGGKYAEEIACAAVMLPLSWATYSGITQDLAARDTAPPSQVTMASQPLPEPDGAAMAGMPMMTAAVAPEPA